jgi:aryl-alcohol dehydrogenase-like predicted oxidoreductase
MLPASLVKALKKVAEEKRQTYSAVAEEWLLEGKTKHEARVK